MYLFIFSFTILGMELYSHKLRFNRENELVDTFSGQKDDTSNKFSIPASNFNNFLNATLSIFIIFANDGWTVIFNDHYRAVGGLGASAFFLSIVVLG
jgi:hypothetical protein